MIRAYIDGACSGNPGPGGWAVVIIRDPGDREEHSGFEEETTNNRMELRAAIEALRHVSSEVPLTIIADSQYVVKGMTEWLEGWKRRGWRKGDRQPPENLDLWQELDRLSAGRKIDWDWTRGHAGHPENERANELAQARALGRPQPAPSVTLMSHEAEQPMPEPTDCHADAFPCYLSLVEGIAVRHPDWKSCEGRTLRVSGAKYKACKSWEEAIQVLQKWGLPAQLPPLGETPEPAKRGSPRGQAVNEVRWFACAFLSRARTYLQQMGFSDRPISGPDIDFDLRRNSATVRGYSTGTIQLQNGTAQDEVLWGKLATEEDNWLREALSTAPQLSAAWNSVSVEYCHTLMSADRLAGWSSEPIGRYLLVRSLKERRAVGVLSASGWRKEPTPGDSNDLWSAVSALRWSDGGRWCTAQHQDSQNNLVMVLFRISLASATLAHAWNWEAGKNANSQDKRRVSSRIRQEVGLLREKEGGQNEWRAEAARLGNQLDVICDWIQQSVLSLGRPLHSSSVDVIMRPSGNEDWCHRLIDQRTGGRLLFRPALLPEEHDCLEMARFLARGARENNYGE